jgi:hypothetical protein
MEDPLKYTGNIPVPVHVRTEILIHFLVALHKSEEKHHPYPRARAQQAHQGTAFSKKCDRTLKTGDPQGHRRKTRRDGDGPNQKSGCLDANVRAGAACSGRRTCDRARERHGAGVHDFGMYRRKKPSNIRFCKPRRSEAWPSVRTSKMI